MSGTNQNGKMNRRDVLKILGGGTLGAYAAARASSTFAAPAVLSAQTKPVTLSYMTWGSTVVAKERDAAVRTAHPELNRIKVNLVVGGQGDLDVAKALRLALASGENIPNMVQLNVTELAEFAEAGELLDLSDVFASVKNDLYAGVLSITQYDGKFVAFPNQLKSKLFYYREDMLAGAGIEPANIKSVDDFINAGKTLHAKYPKSYLLNLGPEPASYWIGEIVSAYPGAQMADKSGNYQLTTQKAFADAFTFLKQIHDSGIALPVDDFTTDWQAAWAKEAIAGSLIADWMKTLLPKFAPRQAGKWKATLWPPLSPLADQRYGSDAGGSIVVIPKRASNTQDAIEYLTKTLLDKAGAMAVFNATGQTPLIKSAKDDVLAAIRNAKKPAGMSESDWLTQPQVFFGAPYYEVELGSYDYARVFAYDPASAKEFPILYNWLYKYLAGKSDLNAALKGAQDDMKSQIGNPYSS